MQSCPKIGDRVKYKGGLAVGPCIGIIEKVYPSEKWEDDGEYDIRPTGRYMLEKNWHVRMKVEKIPEKWCYGQDGVFSPEVCELQKI